MHRRKLLAACLLSTLVQPLSAKESDLSEQVHRNAESAVKQFQERAGGKLDYSVQSLQAVEELLAEAADHRDSLRSATLDTLTELLGCYILEVGYREHGGKFAWFEERKQPVLVVGEPAFHVAMITFGKVRGRLSGDRGDNIPFFYEGFSERVRAAIPGTRALYG